MATNPIQVSYFPLRMTEMPISKKPLSPDWFVHGVLSKFGDWFDRITGRGWKPGSSLATSELIEKLKVLIDSEAREDNAKRRFVPNNISLKIQWDKFSADSEDGLRKLEAELLTAVVDHINDKRYYTYAPLHLNVKPDYFTEGVKLFAGFETLDDDDRGVELDVAIPAKETANNSQPEAARQTQGRLIARFSDNGKPVERSMEFGPETRLSVGRGKENDLTINDDSVSKMHAALKLSEERSLVVADTGSTNGTFINGQRIPYGKAMIFDVSATLKFGTVDVQFILIEPPPEPLNEFTAEVETEPEPVEEVYKVGEFEFTRRDEKKFDPEVTEIDDSDSKTIEMKSPAANAESAENGDRSNP